MRNYLILQTQWELGNAVIENIMRRENIDK